jgi:hypothetical protein
MSARFLNVDRRTSLLRPPDQNVTYGRAVEIREQLRSEERKAIYRKRCHTVERVFGIIKSAMGFRGFSLRGKEKVEGESTLVCLASNLKRMWNLTKPAKKHKKDARHSVAQRAGGLLLR